MPNQRDEYPQRTSPQQPSPAAESIEQQRNGKLQPHPSLLDEAVGGVLFYAILQNEFRWVIKAKLAAKLPPSVLPESGLVGGMRWTFGLALMPIPQIVGADHANRPRHADKGAKPDKGVFDDPRSFKAAMDQQAVHSH